MSEPLVCGYPVDDGDYIISFEGHERIARVRSEMVFVKDSFGRWIKYIGPITYHRKHIPLEYSPDP